MYKLSLSTQSVLNIIGCIITVVINALINLLLSPYIVENLGVAANGYISLANNFISYIALITIALNSMAGRFILIEFRRGNILGANEYYSSVLLGDWLLAGLLFLPMILFVFWIDKFINIEVGYLLDTQILFALIFFNYMVNLCFPQWKTATYCTNNLYLRSFNNAISAIIRAFAIYLLFSLFTPHSYYIAVAACVMTIVSLTMDFWYCKILMPELSWNINLFRIKKVKELLSSGIWNTISQCGNLLLEGLDILIANILINPIAAGVLSLSKVIPNMINQITGTIATTYGPRLTYLFADGNKSGMVDEVKNNMLYVSIIANLPIGIFLAFGKQFFTLWVPSQNVNQLYWLSTCSLLGMLFTGITQCVVNIFGVVNKLRYNSLIVIMTGVINILIVYFLLKFTNIGIYAIALVSSIVSVVRIFCFTLPFGAQCIDASKCVFVIPTLKNAANVLLPLLIGLMIVKLFPVTTWLLLFLLVGITCFLTVLVDYYIILNSEQRKIILRLLHLK